MEKIPADLSEELLIRLPVNNLLKLKLVCKDWRELISSQRFVEKHLRRSVTGCDGSRIVLLAGSGIAAYGTDRTGRPYVRLTIPYPIHLTANSCRIAGSWDGFVCLLAMGSTVFQIMNPSTGEFEGGFAHRITFESMHCYWFGRHPSTGEFLFVTITRSPWCSSSDPLQLEQFPSLKGYRSSVSASVPEAVKFFHKKTPILFRGALHWPAERVVPNSEREVVVLAYDIQENKFMEFLTPFATTSSFSLGVLDGCLSGIIRNRYYRRYELWIMKEYGVKDSWTKYYDIVGLQARWNMVPLGFLPDGYLLLNVDNHQIIKYCSNGETHSIIHVHQIDSKCTSGDSKAVLIADSLASPQDLDKRVLP